ncbi:glycosyltransferase [Micromonospora sp. C28ISP2-4]|uniref:glycosyltransferase n=1 Tax=Micromonospora sp. C28ISP2-4 TaxID=3059523 RepID=UPI0026748310|nr:glycosyltransferase [Micromonospora sp. C28ISP2-4]MDO3683404.1 glycosyltransferase [Micromonospora sp. C28ISP2-4]
MVKAPHVTVFTGSNRTRFLDDCLQSLLAQTYADWEWVVVLNQGTRWRPEANDPRIRLLVRDGLSGVGAVKRQACAEAYGDILVELDDDDLLSSDCLAEVVAAFDANPGVGFVYSDTAQIREDGGRDDSRFAAAHGWRYRDERVDGREVSACYSLEPTPHNVSYIWYAPNHVRAFRRDLYEKVGGYNEELDVADDLDLMCRLYQAAEFHQIPKCLYLQRMHTRNTQRDPEVNARIQRRSVEIYDRNIQFNALAWAKRRDLLAVDMGAAHNKPEGFLGLDRRAGDGVDIVCDVTKGIDLPDDSVGVIRAVDFLEHIPDKIGLFNELYRVLAPNGLLLSLTPSTDGRGAYQDPTHVAFYNENSFWYFTNDQYARFVPEIRCRFQVSRLGTYFPSEFHQANNIPYVVANLIAVKDETRNGGLLTI